ncbi:hypothetical protein P691DRAFT_803073, partial [Macrolepiota fuliginosa MF-IS2]
DVLYGGNHEEPPKPQTPGDKIRSEANDAPSGGACGEAEEEHLDKAIDFFQEHKNGSASEQVKDKQTAGAVRHGFERITGKELPSHKKE